MSLARTVPRHLLLWMVVGAAVAAVLARLSTGEALRLLGLPDPGVVTTVGLPVAMAVGEIAAVVMVGSLLLAAVLVPPQPSGVLDVDGCLAVRTAGIAASVWAGSAVLLVPLTLSDTSGRPLGDVVTDPLPFLRTVGDIEVTRAWAWTAVLGIVVAVGCVVTLRHRWTPVLLALAVISLLPRAVSGHSATGGDHDIATNSLVLHLIAATVWVGGLAALVLHVRRGGEHLDVALRRFSVIATAAFAVVAVSGVVNALVRVPIGDLLTSAYGVLVFAKVAALVLGGTLGWRQRRFAVRAVTDDPDDRSAFARLAVAETLLLVATVGLAVALGRTPPPPPRERREPSVVEEVLGYALSGPPSASRLALEWRVDLLFGAVAVALVVCYLLGVRKMARAGLVWSRGRTTSWLCGCALVLVATSSGLGRFAPAVFSVHSSAIAILGLAAPLCLAAGAPLTLARYALGPSGPAAVPGLREWLKALHRGWPVRALTRPLVVWALFAGGFAWFHLGGVYDSVAGSHVWHVLANAYVLTTGYLVFWVGLGTDPTGHPRLSRRDSLFFMGSALVAYVAVAAILRTGGPLVAADYYTSLRRDWLSDLAADQRLGSTIALVAGLGVCITAVVMRLRGGADEQSAAASRRRVRDLV
ncbi:copper resistance D precursor [Nocardia cyriacigeorgica]|nr:copper resistance D precursor [Nocardia cyriacigeorgica]